MKCYNAFGITPTNSFTSAGSDYYIPNLKDENQIKLALKAFEKSYKKSSEQINMIYNEFKNQYEHKDEAANLTHLFLATYDKHLEAAKTSSIESAVKYFINNFVVYDRKKKVVGVALKLNDTLFINSGIKVALPTINKNLGIGIGGLYVNKSGKGNAGFDTRAVLVDEDYSGYVHLSMAYTKDLFEIGQNIIYCGDKFTQMILIPVYHEEYEEINEDEYNKIMKDSLRGSNGFGSSDIKH
jgi:dUTPase